MTSISGINPAENLRKLRTRIMPHNQCKWAHRKTQTTISANKNICAGGEQGKLHILQKQNLFINESKIKSLNGLVFYYMADYIVGLGFKSD